MFHDLGSNMALLVVGLNTLMFAYMGGRDHESPYHLVSIAGVVAFMLITVLVVLGGIERGIERWAVILMPTLLLMLVALLVRSFALDGFSQAVSFVFGMNTDQLTPDGVLEAMGHAFFTLSIGMGGMLTYGSYLSRKESIVGSSLAVGALDTAIAEANTSQGASRSFKGGLSPHPRRRNRLPVRG